jgi:hypothetical protein
VVVGAFSSFFWDMITQHRIQDSAKAGQAHKLFGIRFIWVESFVFDTAASLSADYDGGSREFYCLSNGGFFMCPEAQAYEVECAKRL